MGKRGPAKTPTAILKLHGSRLAKDRDKVQPKPSRGAPRCPASLSDEAKQVWRQIVPKLIDMRVLCKVDAGTLERYCDEFARWRRASDFIKQHGESYPIKNADGSLKYVQQFPQVSISSKLSASLLRIEQEFGLTPSARAGLSVTPQPTADPKQSRYFA